MDTAVRAVASLEALRGRACPWATLSPGRELGLHAEAGSPGQLPSAAAVWPGGGVGRPGCRSEPRTPGPRQGRRAPSELVEGQVSRQRPRPGLGAQLPVQARLPCIVSTGHAQCSCGDLRPEGGKGPARSWVRVGEGK